MRNYSPTIKEKMLRQLLGPDAISSTALSKKTGIAQSTLSKWVKQHREKCVVRFMGDSIRPVDWSAEKKFKTVMEYEALSEEEKGPYLRRNGLHEGNIKSWKKAMLKGFKEKKSPKKSALEAKQIKKLQKEIERKDKALAEASALLILKKKADLIWGDKGEES